MTRAEFKKAYDKSETWKDLDDILDQTDRAELLNLLQALKTVKDFTGLDMRQDFLSSILKGRLNYGM